jgi:hypothetical protein
VRRLCLRPLRGSYSLTEAVAVAAVARKAVVVGLRMQQEAQERKSWHIKSTKENSELLTTQLVSYQILFVSIFKNWILHFKKELRRCPVWKDSIWGGYRGYGSGGRGLGASTKVTAVDVKNIHMYGMEIVLVNSQILHVFKVYKPAKFGHLNRSTLKFLHPF